MTKRYLINRMDIAEFRDISNTVHDKVLNQFITDAQFADLQPLLGSNFFNDLERNFDSASDPNYKFLLNGGDYTHNGVTYTCYGLKVVLVHFAYGRYILLGSNKDTPFGHVVKTSESSQPSSDANKKTIHKQCQQLAFNYWENVRTFLNRKADDYPLWKEGGCSTVKGSFRMKRIG